MPLSEKILQKIIFGTGSQQKCHFRQRNKENAHFVKRSWKKTNFNNKSKILTKIVRKMRLLARSRQNTSTFGRQWCKTMTFCKRSWKMHIPSKHHEKTQTLTKNRPINVNGKKWFLTKVSGKKIDFVSIRKNLWISSEDHRKCDFRLGISQKLQPLAKNIDCEFINFILSIWICIVHYISVVLILY